MESRKTQTANRQVNFDEYFDSRRESDLVHQRLNILLAANAETERQKSAFHSEKERAESQLLKNPLNLEKTFSYFGLILGTLAPASIFAKFAIDSGMLQRGEVWILGVLFIVNLISAIVGYFSGKLIANSVREIEKYPWWAMLLFLPFVGMLWGMISGGAGGVVIFLFGAFFGAILGGAVGAAALPLFVIFHRLLKKGEMIERNHFLPIAFGITLTICSFIFGL